MKKNLIGKIGLATLAVSILIGPASASAARQIGSFARFSIPQFQGVVYTGYLTKAIDGSSGSNVVVNVTNTDSVSTLETAMYNTSNQLRSTYTIMNVPNKNEIGNTGSAGYSYREMFMNHVSTVFQAAIWGSWSPDNK